MLNQAINQQQREFSTIPEKEINQILYDDNNVVELFRDNSIALLKLISSNMDSQIHLLSLVTGARMKKIRWLLKNVSEEAVVDFDNTLKEIFMQFIDKFHEQKNSALEKQDLNLYLHFFSLIQNMMKEWYTYSKWTPIGYTQEEDLKDFDNMWDKVSKAELPHLPKFFNSVIKFVDKNSEKNSDSIKEQHLGSLMKIYAFLLPEQKKTFLVEFCNEVSKSFSEFNSNFNKLTKSESNIIFMQMLLLDMLLQQACGQMSEMNSLKDLLDHKLLEELFKSAVEKQNDAEVEAENSTSEKVEKLRKMFETILSQSFEITQMSSHTQLFNNIYSVMQDQTLVVPYFLLK